MKSPRFTRGPLLAATLALAFGGAPSRAGTDPADAHADAKTREVLSYIQGLPQRADKRVLSGEFTEFAPHASLDLPEATFRQTGHWPAYIGVDYMNFRGHAIDWAKADRVALAYWRAGGLVEVNVHLYNPLNPKVGYGLRDKGVHLPDLLAAGSPANAAWNRELDAVAAGLGRLQDEGVVVLWRPFHEMSGGWFWWGAKPPEDFKRLWHYLFAYLTERKGLHNLIWIYSPNMGPRAADYYPGDAYVDLVGLDAYTDHLDPAHVEGYPQMLALGKPFGFGEFGPHGAFNPPGDYDYRRLPEALRAHFPAACFFMTWNDKWSPPNNLDARGLFDDPSIVSREDLPKW